MRPSRLIRETVVLRDGRSALLRPIDKTDAERLIDLHNSLSFDSQYYRFFGPKPKLSTAEAEYLAGVDFNRRFALVAEVDENDAHRIVGVGRFDINEPHFAEAAIVVRDDYQGVGLGTIILERMREIGRGAGLDAFTAEILAENTRMIDLLQTQGLEIAPAQSGVVRVIAPLGEPVLFKGLKVAASVAGAIVDRLPGVPGRER